MKLCQSDNFRLQCDFRGCAFAFDRFNRDQVGPVDTGKQNSRKSQVAMNTHTSVTAVTDRPPDIGETSIVNMVQRACKKVLLEPGDTRQQWKGEAATSFVQTGITSSRALPTSSVGYWSPILSCSHTRPPKRRYPSGAFSCPQSTPLRACHPERSRGICSCSYNTVPHVTPCADAPVPEPPSRPPQQKRRESNAISFRENPATDPLLQRAVSCRKPPR